MSSSRPTTKDAPSGRVLYVSAHTAFFIGDQLRAVEKLVAGIDALLPTPFFSGLAVRLSSGDRFASLKRARESKPGTTGRLMRARYFDIPGRYGRNLTDSLASRASLKTISRERAEFGLVHSHFIGLNGLIGSEIKKKFGVPLVVTAYGGDAYSLPFIDGYRRSLAASVIGSADRLIAVSRPIVENLVALGADRSKIRMIPTGYDATIFKPGPKNQSRAELDLPQSKKILLTVANLVQQKGHSFLLGAMSRLTKTRQDILLVVIGGGDLEGALRARAAELGLQDSVVFRGPVAHEEIPTWMKACDLFVLPSISEGTPTVIPEAMACGRPVIATNVGGIPDVIADDSVGYLVPPRDEMGLSDAVILAIDRQWPEQPILEHALQYSWDSVARRIAGVYDEVRTADGSS